MDEALRLLKDEGAEVDARLVDGDEVRQAVREHVVQGTRRVVVAGGDGTITAAVDELAHTDVELAVIPMGTQNNFARTLGVPTDLAAACQLAVNGEAAAVDVGRADGTYFANAVTIGLSSRIARRTPRGLKRVLGQVSYGIVGMRVLMTSRPFSYTISTADEQRSGRTYQLVVANGRRVGQAVAAPGANAHDGMLDVTVLGNGTRRSLLAAWWDFQWGRHAERDDTVLLRAPEVRVEARPARRVDIDGEVAQGTPTRIWVEPGAVRVVVPPPDR